MDIRLLGSVELWHAGQPLPLGPQQQRCLLAALAVPPGRPVSAEVLAERVWGRQLPGNARSSLYTNLSRLRNVIARAGGTLQRDDSGYLLAAVKDDVDLYRARRLVLEAQQLASEFADRPRQAADILREADALWRGTPLADLRGDWADRLRQALHQERLASTVQRHEWELRFSEPATVAHALAELHAESPLAEPVTALLMRALWQSGRQTEALRVFAAARQRVIDELGVEPGADLRQLHQQLLRDDVRSPDPPPPRSPAPPRPAQLPPDIATFTGRGRELAQLPRPAAGEPAPVVVISGVAGVGKTAVVVHWGHDVRDGFPDGQLYVNLRGYAHSEPVLPAQVLARFLPALGVPEERVPTDAEMAEALYRSLLADRAVLVVLDNAIRPDQVRPLLPSGPASMALVTSRDRLDGLVARDGAQPLRLGPLAADEARQLLARVAGPQRIKAEGEPVDELVELCGRLPLALRIAAANLEAHPTRSVAAYVSRMRGDEELTALTVPGDPDSAVSAAFDYSYARLPSAAQRMFRLLGLVPGPDTTVTAAAALAGIGQATAEPLLDELATAHLVEEIGPGRYALLDPLRRYASSRAAQEEPPASRQQARARLFDHYLRRADAAARLLYPHKLRLPPPEDLARPEADRFKEHAQALAWLDDEAAGLAAAAKSASVDGPRPVAWLLADALRGYFEARRVTVDWLAVGHAAVTAAETEGNAVALAHSQLSLADAHATCHQHRAAITHYRRALSTSGSVRPTDRGVETWSVTFRTSVLNNVGAVTAKCGLPRRAAAPPPRSGGRAALRRRGAVGRGEPPVSASPVASPARPTPH